MWLPLLLQVTWHSGSGGDKGLLLVHETYKKMPVVLDYEGGAWSGAVFSRWASVTANAAAAI